MDLNFNNILLIKKHGDYKSLLEEEGLITHTFLKNTIDEDGKNYTILPKKYIDNYNKKILQQVTSINILMGTEGNTEDSSKVLLLDLEEGIINKYYNTLEFLSENSEDNYDFKLITNFIINSEIVNLNISKGKINNDIVDININTRLSYDSFYENLNSKEDVLFLPENYTEDKKMIKYLSLIVDFFKKNPSKNIYILLTELPDINDNLIAENEQKYNYISIHKNGYNLFVKKIYEVDSIGLV